MIVQLALFGAFRDLHREPTLLLEVSGDTVSAVRASFAAHLLGQGHAERSALIRASAFASDQALLHDTEAIPADGRLAILPPVSGG
ncbi:MAG: MoaD/ThiS family protein [Xanthomonadales bacterium]|nr:hypothetical protein [Xanthomonadales bacterium]MCC6593710.1 MoaD/ThiS family protein [Xanthomonadales bacterium]MCE7931050.1 molybdopterin converting factor [Xanthomonadales bacterium PRO6]